MQTTTITPTEFKNDHFVVHLSPGLGILFSIEIPKDVSFYIRNQKIGFSTHYGRSLVHRLSVRCTETKETRIYEFDTPVFVNTLESCKFLLKSVFKLVVREGKIYTGGVFGLREIQLDTIPITIRHYPLTVSLPSEFRFGTDYYHQRTCFDGKVRTLITQKGSFPSLNVDEIPELKNVLKHRLMNRFARL